jgi:hypothetical protein
MQSATSARVDLLVNHWLAPVRRLPVLWGEVDARHDGTREPVVTEDPSSDHEGCLGCTAWARTVSVSVRNHRIYLRIKPDSAMFPYVQTVGCGNLPPEVKLLDATTGYGDREDASLRWHWHGTNLNARLLTVLRLLAAALASGNRWLSSVNSSVWPDFDFQLSLDDNCHGSSAPMGRMHPQESQLA